MFYSTTHLNFKKISDWTNNWILRWLWFTLMKFSLIQLLHALVDGTLKIKHRFNMESVGATHIRHVLFNVHCHTHNNISINLGIKYLFSNISTITFCENLISNIQISSEIKLFEDNSIPQRSWHWLYSRNLIHYLSRK